MPDAVTEVDEHQAAVVAAAVNPARDAHALADAPAQHVPAPRVAVRVRRGPRTPCARHELAARAESETSS